MNVIVYTSESGFTKKYAQMLSEKTGMPVYEISQAKDSNISSTDKVIYMGWIMAGMIKDYKKALRKYNICAVCAVGMSSPDNKIVDTTKKQNGFDNIPLFYLQGGYNIKKLHGINKLMMKAFSSIVGKKLEKKPDKTEKEKEMLDMLKNGGDKTDEKNLSSVLDWYAQFNS